MKMRIGAGTMIALVVGLAIIGYHLYQQKSTASQPPMVTREVRGMARGITPAPEFLLRHRELALTPVQTQRIGAIATAYRKDVASVQRRLTDAAEKYREFMERTKQKTRPDIQEIQRNGAEVQRLTGVVATTRQTYWQQARAVLTAAQQQRVDALVRGAELGDLL